MGTVLCEQMLVFLCIFLAFPVIDGNIAPCTGNGQFFGGSVSYTMEEVGGKFMVKYLKSNYNIGLLIGITLMFPRHTTISKQQQRCFFVYIENAMAETTLI